MTPVAPVGGQTTSLSALVTRCTASNPGLMTGPGTNSYVVGTTDLIVIDPGPDDDEHLDALVTLGAGRIRTVAVTHTHPDHAPGARRLAALTGAELVGHSARDGFDPTRTLTDGDELCGGGFVLRALHTPGHASDHLCFHLFEENLLFSGDHVVQGSTVVISPPDGDMAQYLESLRRLRALAPPLHAMAPGHGALMTDPATAVDALVAHRLERERIVIGALAEAGPSTVDDLVTVVYADVDQSRHGVARRSLWAHLRKLGDEGRARTTDRDDPAARWEAVPG